MQMVFLCKTKKNNYCEILFLLSKGILRNLIPSQLRNFVILVLLPNKMNINNHSISAYCISDNTYLIE
jgi:hypothetical protein